MDRDILLKDLCARIPYGVICNYREGLEQNARAKLIGWEGSLCVFDIKIGDKNGVAEIYSTMPYLRPMSSMTKDEEKMFLGLKNGLTFNYATKKAEYNMMSIDWLNAHHFDYRGLIDKGMALVAPNGMYN